MKPLEHMKRRQVAVCWSTAGALGDGVQGKGAWPCGFVGFVHNVNHRRITIIRTECKVFQNIGSYDKEVNAKPAMVADPRANKT